MGITPAELAILTDIRDHEVIHREFFCIALSFAGIPTLTFDVGSIDWNTLSMPTIRLDTMLRV